MSRLRNSFSGVSGAAVLVVLAASATAQEALPTIDVGAAQRGPDVPGSSSGGGAGPTTGTGPAAPPGFSEKKLSLPVYRDPTGQTFTTVSDRNFQTTPLATVREMLQYSPGVSFKIGNGPRDVIVSIRGSGARNGFGVRNIVMLEDGFSVTQPDGLSRTDLTDPHAYAGIDVYRGPSSALFGNFANGGAINFRTRTGADINGVEYGGEFGSFGYINNYVTAGEKTKNYDIAAFASDVRGDGWSLHNGYNTQTVNMTARVQATPDDLLTFKGIHNQLYGDLSSRLSLNQYYLNPYQSGCYAVPNSAATSFTGYIARSWCGQTTVFLNGIAGTQTQTTAWLAGFNRDDRRDVFGLRWEHDFDKDTQWRTQAIYDDKNISQPTGATAALQDEPAVNATTDITKFWSLAGHDARSMLGMYFNRTRYVSYTLNTLPVGDGATGATTAKQNAMMQNMGWRGRQELALSKDVTMVLGLAAEMTKIAALQDTFTYVATGRLSGRPNGGTSIPVNKTYWNFGPEASITWRVLPELTTHWRVSSGYGTPNPGQLFVTQQGVNGANTDLKTQTNTGIDAGLVWSPQDRLTLSLTGFYEWYNNEQLTQSPGAGLLSYTFNAPGSVHRGVETQLEWKPVDGWSLLGNYTYNNQMFTNFTEILGTANPGGRIGYFNRAGYKIPGVAPHNLTARLGYDQPDGDWRGVGAYVEYVFQSSYYIDNGNVLTIPAFGLVNFNLHVDRDVDFGPLKKLAAYFEIRNIADNNWVAGANNLTNRVSNFRGLVVQNGYVDMAQNATGSMYAGNPRLFTGGVKFKF